MTFVKALNDYTIVLILLLGINLMAGLCIGFKNGGWNRHLPYMLSIIVFLVYTLITPIFFWMNERKDIIGTDISNYYGAGFFFALISSLSFVIGYWIKGWKEKGKWFQQTRRITSDSTFKISIVFYFIYAIVLMNLAIGGANITDVFFGNAVLGLGAEGASYYFQNFSDSLIAVLVLAYLLDVPKRKLLIWIFASFFLFSILGFRYRIILSLIGLLFVYFYKNKIRFSIILWSGLIGLMFFYFVMFSTANRKQLIFKQYSSLVYNPLEFEYDAFFEQTRGALPDMAVYKLYDNPNRVTSHDYGMTMFAYIFIRIIPRSIFPNKDDFYPPPQLATTVKAYDSQYAKFAGEATLAFGALYIAGGWLGLVIGGFLWGYFLRMRGDKIIVADRLDVITWIVIALASFQWITRGYFPQVVDHFVYLMIPVWIMQYLSKKTPNNATN